MNQLELFVHPNPKGTMNYQEVKERFDDKYNYRDILILDRSGTKLIKNAGYFSLEYWNFKDLLRLYPDGRILVNLGNRTVMSLRDDWRGRDRIKAPSNKGVYTAWSINARLNRFLPFGWHFYSFRYHTMMSKDGIDVEAPAIIEFDKNGELTPATKANLGRTHEELDLFYRKQYQKLDAPRRRGRYWTRRARNLYTDRSKCLYNARENRHKCQRRHAWPR